MPGFLAHRDRRDEVMDDPGLDAAEHARALAGLARLNRLSMIAPKVWRALKPLAARGPLRVLDVAAGSGDLVVNLARRARRDNIDMCFGACDISDFACGQITNRAAAEGLEIDVYRLDALRDPLPGGYGVVMCHLFLHHLDGPDAAGLLGRMRSAAGRGVFATDLVRSVRGYGLALIASRIATRSRVVHTDALLSVRAAFTPAELADLAERAGLLGARIRTVWPQRMVLTCGL